MSARLLWIGLPTGVGGVAAICVGLGYWVYWGPVFAITVALAAQATGRVGGLIAAAQASALFDFLVLPPAFEFSLDCRTIVASAIFVVAVLIFQRGRFIGAKPLRSISDVIAW